MSAAWRRTHPEGAREERRRYRRKLKQEAVDAYGGKCATCGETAIDLLEIHHLHEGGNEHRDRLFGYGHASPGGWNFYLWLKKNRWPKGFGVLCRRDHPRERRAWDGDEEIGTCANV